MDPMIGKMLDNRYELLEEIGSGGMAIVYKAKCHRLNRLVAVKVLKSELAEDADFRRRFRDESQAVAMLSHPNIVSVYDVSRGATEYIVMELIDGITLKQYMERRGQLNWREALHFILQIMHGLSHAHSRGIVHRDIKPQNIMVLRDGSVKVADFGIACLSNENTQSMTQMALGSVHYISPEQAKGNSPDARSDIYSAGVVLYEMLTSRLPFVGDSEVSVALQHLSSIPLSPREINPEVPEVLEKICMKAMASDINCRYPSADAMIADLEAFRKNPDADLDFAIEDPNGGEEPTQILPQLTDEDEEEAEEERGETLRSDRKLQRMILILGVAVICLAAIVLLGRPILSSFQRQETTVSEYDVPNLVGMTVDEAKVDDRVFNIFTIDIKGQRTSDVYPAGVIVEQMPSGGKVGKMNRTITVFVSTGPKSAVVPDLSNEEFRTARLRLNQLGLNIEISQTEEYSEDITSGRIVRTIPEFGEPVYVGSEVVLVISIGPKPKPIAVPAFVGMPVEEAQAMCLELGITLNVSETRDSLEKKNTVIWQSIAPAEEIDPGTEISLVISSGAFDEEVAEPAEQKETEPISDFDFDFFNT